MRSLVLGCFACLLFAPAAFAECRVDGPPTMFLGNNASYDLSIDMQIGTSCNVSFTPLNPAVRFESATIAVAAKTGTLAKRPPLSFLYVAPAKGRKDRFVLKVCETDTHGKGCDVLRYDVTLHP